MEMWEYSNKDKDFTKISEPLIFLLIAPPLEVHYTWKFNGKASQPVKFEFPYLKLKERREMSFELVWKARKILFGIKMWLMKIQLLTYFCAIKRSRWFANNFESKIRFGAKRLLYNQYSMLATLQSTFEFEINHLEFQTNTFL